MKLSFRWTEKKCNALTTSTCSVTRPESWGNSSPQRNPWRHNQQTRVNLWIRVGWKFSSACFLPSCLPYTLLNSDTSLILLHIGWVHPEEVAHHEIQMMAHKKQATKLDHILNHNDIAVSVQTLSLSCYEVNFRDSTSGALISTILHRLPHIWNFTLEPRFGVLKFPSIARDFLSAIWALWRSPNLTTLNLVSIQDFPITTIDTCPNLRSLRLVDVEFRVNHILSALSTIANPIFQFDNASVTEETSNPDFFHLDSLAVVQKDSIRSLSSAISGDTSFAKHFSRIKNLKVL
jgi:hypothetical protein